jgi:hypothetical protein
MYQCYRCSYPLNFSPQARVITETIRCSRCLTLNVLKPTDFRELTAVELQNDEPPYGINLEAPLRYDPHSRKKRGFPLDDFSPSPVSAPSRPVHVPGLGTTHPLHPPIPPSPMAAATGPHSSVTMQPLLETTKFPRIAVPVPITAPQPHPQLFQPNSTRHQTLQRHDVGYACTRCSTVFTSESLLHRHVFKNREFGREKCLERNREGSSGYGGKNIVYTTILYGFGPKKCPECECSFWEDKVLSIHKYMHTIPKP